MVTGRVVVEFNRFADLAAALPRETAAVTGKTVLDLEAEIKQNIVGVDAIDTGFMLNRTHGHPADGTVTNDAEYVFHVNDGTTRMPARPFIEPAAEAVAPQYAAALEQMLGRIGG
jgi:hypothetical protein